MLSTCQACRAVPQSRTARWFAAQPLFPRHRRFERDPFSACFVGFGQPMYARFSTREPKSERDNSSPAASLQEWRTGRRLGVSGDESTRMTTSPMQGLRTFRLHDYPRRSSLDSERVCLHFPQSYRLTTRRSHLEVSAALVRRPLGVFRPQLTPAPALAHRWLIRTGNCACCFSRPHAVQVTSLHPVQGSHESDCYEIWRHICRQCRTDSSSRHDRAASGTTRP